MAFQEIIQSYFSWPEREKWLLVRDFAYKTLRARFFESPSSIDRMSYSDFFKQYLGFCTLRINGVNHKLTVNSTPAFFEKYSLNQIESLISTGSLEVIGNASWSQLHLGMQKDNWLAVKRLITFLLFGDNNTHLSKIDEQAVLDRLKVVMNGKLMAKGFGKAKITPLLLICDEKNRFGIWNNVSDEALSNMGLIPRSDLTGWRSVSNYTRLNKALNQLKNDYAFKDLADVDLFVWYYLEQENSGPIDPPNSNGSPATSMFMVKTNPLMQTAMFSLLNALEFFYRAEERHRQGAMIMMDQAVEYVLKAKLYQVDHIQFINKELQRLGFEDVLQKVNKHVTLLEEDQFHLRRVHSARNSAQHRAVIPGSAWTREYMDWVYTFIDRFCYENFGVKIEDSIPQEFRNGL